ncbi:MAG TPA: hypothetical protein VJ965_11730, partial [Anaerolineales bacterium]|nr:hypothetical protein [Anaerolineales bacterium]
ILLLTAYLTWKLGPDIERLSLLISHEKGSPEEMAKLRKRRRQVVNLNMILSVVVLLLTSLARVQ